MEPMSRKKSNNTYCEFWNDIDIEKEKPFFIQHVADLKLMNHLEKETNLNRCFKDAIQFAEQFGGVRNRVLDVGAGVAWTSAIISKLDSVEFILASDYSRHRLTEIAPIIFEQMGGKKEKYGGIVGDFWEMEFPKNYFQTIVFCQSLYMFSPLEKILKRVSDLLAPGGILMIACERISPEFPSFSVQNLKKQLSRILKGRVDSSGNHFYEDRDYINAIKGADLDDHFQLLDYPIYYKTSTWPAGNYFGIKRLNT